MRRAFSTGSATSGRPERGRAPRPACALEAVPGRSRFRRRSVPAAWYHDVLGTTMNLDSFHPAVAGWFRGRFEAPTEPQVRAWPSIQQGRHTLIAAPTGSGKTL